MRLFSGVMRMSAVSSGRSSLTVCAACDMLTALGNPWACPCQLQEVSLSLYSLVMW